MIRSFISPLIVVVLAAPMLSQVQEKPAQRDDKIVLGTTEVMLDVFVRDKKGRPLKNLGAADFEVYEDGVKQRIESLQFVSPSAESAGDAAKGAQPAIAETRTPARRGLSELSLVAMVFDRLSPGAQVIARKAAVSYAAERKGRNEFTSVCVTDLTLQVIQPLTNDPEAVRNGILRATHVATPGSTGQAGKAADRARGRDALEQIGPMVNQIGASGGTGSPASVGSSAGVSGLDAAMLGMRQRMAEHGEMIDRNQQGYATTGGLSALIDSLRTLPGRKAVILFSEGLVIPVDVVGRFREVISAAKRANVTIYTVDAAGLRIGGPDDETRNRINALAQQSLYNATSGSDDANGPMLRALEANEDALMLNPDRGLIDLAEQTGGFLIKNTNDLSPGLRRVDEDIHSHYELSYVPDKAVNDGRFRRVSVKVARPNVDVQSRDGYYALGVRMDAPVLDYEAPAIAVLTSARIDNSIPLRQAALSFPEPARPGLVPVLVETPEGAFTHVVDEVKKAYTTDFSIVVLIKDSSQDIVRKLSRHYLLSGDAEKVEAAKRGQVLYYGETRLPPGSYTIEVAVYDAPSGKSGVQTTALNVPESKDSRLSLSSVVLVKQAEKLQLAEQRKVHPFHFGEVLIYPNLAGSVRKSAAHDVALFFTAYATGDQTEKRTYLIQLSQNGRAQGEILGELGAPDSSGRIQQVNAFPLESFQPGNYEVKVTVKEATAVASRSTKLVIEP
ncbi:MAG TPA: VWA domain-containing protein [Blastocatellia bacterium]|nr:VWA domain-containing protein [Blastocatellia bacterium]